LDPRAENRTGAENDPGGVVPTGGKQQQVRQRQNQSTAHDRSLCAHQYDNGNTDEGLAVVFNGSSGGLNSSAAWSTEGNQDGARYGVSVASAGDVNNDGYDDALVGAHTFDNGGYADAGKTYLYHGSSTGLATSPNWTYTLNQTGALLGIVSSAGDVNNDGYDDVVVGAFSYDNDQTNEGRVYVFHGSSTTLAGSPNQTMESDNQNSLFGLALSSGDVNGDGYSDVFVGAEDFTNGQSLEGKVFVYHGSGSGINATPVWSIESNQAEAHIGSGLSTAGDIKGDGFEDLLVGAKYYDNGQSDEGQAYVFYAAPAAITGLDITFSTPVEPGVAKTFQATITTGEAVTYNWVFTPHNGVKTGSGATVEQTFVVTYTAQVTATNATNSQTTSEVVTLQ
jgi:hypothetical protein